MESQVLGVESFIPAYYNRFGDQTVTGIKEENEQIKNKMSQDTASQYGSAIKNVEAEFTKEDSNELLSLQTQIQNARDEAIQNYLNTVEAQILKDQSDLIKMINNNDSEENIRNKISEFLKNVAKYNKVSSKESWSSKINDSDMGKLLGKEGFGFVEGKSMVQWAKEYMANDSKTKTLQAERAKLVQQMSNTEEIELQAEKEIQSELNNIDSQIASIEKQKIAEYANQLLRESKKSKKKGTKKQYFEEFVDLLMNSGDLTGYNLDGIKFGDIKRSDLEAYKKWGLEQIDKGMSDYYFQSFKNKGEKRNVEYENPGEINPTEKQKEKVMASAEQLEGLASAASAAKESIESQKKAMEDRNKALVDEQIRKDDKDKKITGERQSPWRKWYYADMTEDEALISSKIHSLTGKAFAGAATQSEKELLATLRDQARRMGLEINDKGYVKAKVTKDEFMANPDKYSIPTITKEKAEAMGVSTLGTVAGTVQPVTITDPINVGTVSSVASVNLGTIESLLSAIAAKIGADTSGIRIGRNNGSNTGNNTKQRRSLKSLKRIVNNSNSKEEIDNAISEALGRNPHIGLGRNKLTNRLFIASKNGPNYDKKITEDWLREHNITQSKQQTSTTSTSRNAKNANSNLRTELNNIINNPNSTKQQIADAFKKGLQSGWMGIGKNPDGSLFLAKKSGKNYNAEETDKYIRANNIIIEEKDNSQTKRNASKSSLRALASEANAKYDAAPDPAGREAVLREYLSKGLKIGIKHGGKRDGEYYFAAKRGDAALTAQKIEELGIQVAESVQGETEQPEEELSEEVLASLREMVNNLSSLQNRLKQLEEEGKDDSELRDSIRQVENTLDAAGLKKGPDGKYIIPGKKGKAKTTQSKSTKIQGYSDRNGKVYTAEDFEKQEGLAEQVIKSGKSQATKDTDAGRFWKESIANAQAYIEVLNHIDDDTTSATTSTIDLTNALESMRSILSSSGRDGLRDALSQLTNKQLQDILKDSSNQLDSNKISKLKKDDLINRIVGGVNIPISEAEMKKAYSDQYSSAAEKAAKAHQEAAATYIGAAQSMSDEAKEAERLAKVRQEANRVAESYENADELEKAISKKQRILANQVKKPETKEKYEAELEAMRNRLNTLKPSSGVDDDTEELKENESAAEDAAEAHEKLDQAMNHSGDSSVDGDTQDLKETAKAAEEAGESYEQLAKARKTYKRKDATKPDFSDMEKARDIMKDLNPDIKFGNMADFTASTNSFRYRDELNDYIYRWSKKGGSVLSETPEVLKELSELEKLESRIEKLKNSSSINDISRMMPEMFADTDKQRKQLVEAQELITTIQNLKTRDSEDLSLLNKDEIDRANNDINRLLELVKKFQRQSVGDEMKVGESSGGLITAREDLEAYFRTIDDGNASIERFNNSNTQMTYTLRTVDDMIETHTVSINQYGEMIDKLTQSEKYVSPFQQMIGGLGSKFRELVNYFVASTSIYEVFNVFKQGVSIVKDLDDAFTEMRKVSEETVSSLRAFQDESFGIANSVGTTAQQIQESTASWMRLGETLEQAKESAKDATILLNVSEFSNIDEATESLVAMSQAYKDLGKMDIIDKLNNIGNNFSISTSDLAASLQKSAGALKTTGNTIDEAIALTVAGNQVLQAPDIVGQSLKTISLRLTGTSVEDMQEAGEEIDGLISTQSKLRKTIMDITKVSSNDYMGFDILDENGNYKSTFEMLSGIAEVYKEIGEEDKRLGTNRQSLLLETIAGKTRAAAASSILDNFETLQKVYKSSLDSQGSAQQELDKYLDSISGKMNIMQNNLQQLATTSIDSEGLKVLLDIINAILPLVNQLIDKFGTFNMILGGLGGFFGQKKGFGFFDTGKGTIFDKLFSDDKKVRMRTVQKTVQVPLSDFMKDAFDKIGTEADDFFDALTDIGITENELLNSGDSALLSLINELGGVQKGAISSEEAYRKLTTAVVTTKEPIVESASAFSKLGSGIASFGKTVLSSLAFTAALIVVEELIKKLYELATAHKRAIEAGKEAEANIKSSKKNYDEMKTSISQVQKEYAELSTGVDASDGKVKNKNLSEDQFNRYLELSQQISQIAPELVTGWTEQGTAIVNLGNDVDTVNSKFQEFLGLEEQMTNISIGKDLTTMFEGIQEEVKDYVDQRDTAQARLDELSSKPDLNVQARDYNEQLQDTINRDTQFITVLKEDQAEFSKLLLENGVDSSFDSYFDLENGRYQYAVNLDEITDEQLKNIQNFFFSEKVDESQETALSSAQVGKAKALIENAYKKVIPAIQDYVETSPLFNFYDLSDTMTEKYREGFKSMFSNIDYYSISKDVEAVGGMENYIDGIISEFMATEDTREATQNLIKLAEDHGEMTYKEIVEARNAEYEKIKEAFPEYSTKDLDVMWGYAKRDAVTGKTVYKTKSRIQRAAEKLGLYNEKSYNFEGRLNEYDSQYADQALSAIEAMPQTKAKSMAMDWKKIWDYIKPYLTGEKSEIPREGILSDILGSETYQANVEQYRTKLSSIGDALSSLAENGHLTNEEMMTLQETFNDMTLEDFTTEGLRKRGVEELTNWIDEFKSAWTDFSPEGEKQLDTYLSNMIASYSDLIADEGTVSDTIRKSLEKDYKSRQDYMRNPQAAAYSAYDEVISSLKSEYGDELNWNIVLALKDEFTGDIEELKEKYGDYEAVWKLRIELEETQGNIDALLSQRETNSSELNLLEATGFKADTSYYDKDNAISRALIESYNNQIAIAEKDIEDNPKNEKLVRTAQENIAELQRKILAEQTNIENNNRSRESVYAENISDERERIASEMERIESDIAYKQSKGQTIFDEENKAMISAIQKDNDQLIKEEQRLERKKGDLEDKWRDRVFDNEEYTEVISALEQNQKDQTANQQKIEEYQKQIDESPILQKKNIAEFLAMDTQQAEQAISEYESLGKNVTEAMYDAAITAAQAEADNLQDIYEDTLTLANDFKERFIEENNLQDASEEEVNNLLQQNDVWKQYQSDLQGYQSSISGIMTKIFNWGKQKKNTPINELNVELQQLKREADEINRELSDEKSAPTAEGYIRAMENNADQITNLQEQIAIKQEELNNLGSEYKPGDSEYDAIQSEIDSLTDSLNSATDAQNDFIKSLINLPTENVSKAIEKYQRELSDLEAQQEYNATKGIAKTAQDYDDTILANQRIANKSKFLDFLYKIQDNTYSMLGYSADSEQRQQIQENISSNRGTLLGALGNIFTSKKEKADLPITQANKDLALLQNTADEYKDTLEDTQRITGRGTKENYESLIGNADEQIALLETISSLNKQRMEDEGVESEFYSDYASAYIQAEQEINSLRQSQKDWNNEILNMPVVALKEEFSGLEQQVTEINDLISLKQAKGLKVTEKEYKALSNLSKQQIANLKKQNDELEAQYQTTGDITQKQQILSDIAANKSAINSAMVDIENYNDQARNIALTNAQALAGAVSSALGEMATETGLTTDTIKTLTTQFSDLADSADISSIFYNTADGVKVDVVAMQRLAEAERDIASSQIQGDISTVQDMIKNLGADGDTTALQQYQDELARLSQQQSEVFAQYQAMMDAMNQHGMIELADQTKNAGAEYDKAINYAKEAKEMWDKGLIGTDDFKERARYFDAYGRTDADTFKKNWDERLSRYFGEADPFQDMINFWDDMVKKGLATESESGYLGAFTDTQAAAEKMGLSLEAFNDLVMKGNDYGATNVVVTSMEDATLQTKELNHELAAAQSELAKMKSSGAAKEAIEAQEQEVANIQDKLGMVREATSNLIQNSNKEFVNGLKGFGSYMEEMKGYYDTAEDAGDSESMRYYAEQMRAEAEKYGIELKADLTFDEAQVQDKLDQITPKIDLQNRPQVDSQKLRDVGWDVEGNGTATVFSSSYSDDKGNTVVMTPILPNGDVYEPTALKEYANEILSGAEDTKGLELRMFSGEDSVAQADRYGEALHRAQEAWYGTDDAQKQAMTTLQGYSAELLHSIDYQDGTYDASTEGAAQAEQAVDALMSSLGLSGEYAHELIDAMLDMGLLADESPYVAQMDEFQSSATSAIQKVKELQANGTIDIDFDVENNGVPLDELQSQITQLRQERAEMTPGTEAYSAVDSVLQQKEAVYSIRTQVEGAEDSKAKLEELKGMTDEQLISTFKIDVNTEEGQQKLESIKQQLASFDGSDFTTTVKIDSGQMDTLTSSMTSTKMDIIGNNEDVKAKIEEAKSAAESAKPKMTINGNAAPAKSEAISAVSTINGMHPTLTIGANTSGITGAINSALAAPHTITVRANVVGMPKASGTMLSPSHAQGTVKTVKKNGQGYNVLNYIPMSSYANGRVALDHDEEALVNEFAPNRPESIVRDGQWMIIPGGPHIENLKKNDIIFNADQTEMLLKKGKTYTPGRALADGTVRSTISHAFVNGAWNGMPAHGNTGDSTGFNKRAGGKGTSSSTKATANNTKATNANTKATNKNSSSKKKEAEVIDWVEVRLERLGRATDNVAKTITDFVSKIFKKTQLTKQIQKVQDQIDANIEGQKKYEERAKKVKFTEKEAVYRDKVLNGKMQIEDIKDENLQKKIADYKEWTEKALDCRDAVQELRNTQLELFADWAHIPTEYAEKAIDKLAAKYDELEGKTKMASGSGSKIATYAKLEAEEREKEVAKVQASVDTKNAESQAKVSSTGNTLTKANEKLSAAQEKDATTDAALSTAIKNIKNKSKTAQWNKVKKYVNAKKEIPSSVLKKLNKTTKALAEKYNKELKAAQAADKEVTSASTAQKKAQTAYNTAVNEAKSMDELTEERKQANVVYQDAKTKAATAKETYDKKQTDLTNAKNAANKNKTLKKNSAVQKAMKNGTAISDATLKKLKGDALKLAKNYNKALKEANSTKSAYDKADATRKTTLAALEDVKDRIANYEDLTQSNFLDELTEQDVAEDATLAELPSYEYANQDLDTQVKNLKDQMYKSVEAYKQVLDIATDTQKELDAAKDALGKLGNETYNKKIAQGENIDISNVKDQKTLDLLVAYNMALQRNVIAQDELVEARKNKNEAEMAYVDATVDKAQEGLDNIEAYFGSLVDWYQNQQSFFESEMSNKKSLGLDLNRDDFQDQLNMIKEREKALWDDVEVQEAWLKAQVDAGNIQVNSEEYRKMQGAINDLASAANKASDEYRELEDEMRVELYIKPIDDAIEKLNDLSSALGNVNSMIVDAMKYDDAGRFTDYGLASLAVDVSDYNAARSEIEKLIQKRNEYIKQFKENDTDYAESEFLKDMTEVEKAISQATVDADGKRRKVISSIIAQAQEELKVTNELIKAEKERWQKQKEYNDYDKKLKEQNKELQKTRQQLAAIADVEGKEAAAQRARLEAQRQEQEDSLKDTIEEHVYSMRIEGLDDLSEQLQKNFDEWSEDLSGDLQKLTDALYNTTNVINESMALNNQTIEKVYSSFGINGLGMTSAGVSLIPGEPIKFNDATYTPLDSSQVFTAPTFTMGIPQIETLGQQLAAATEKSIQTIAASATGGNTINNYNIQSMFDVAGNLDSVSAKQVVDIIANKYPDIFAYVAKEMKNGHIQAGYKI